MSKKRKSETHEWLGLRELTEYAAVSERTLRAWIHDLTDPLPAVQVQGKILVRKSQFDSWLEQHRVKLLAGIDVDDTVSEVLKGVAGGR